MNVELCPAWNDPGYTRQEGSNSSLCILLKLDFGSIDEQPV